MSNQRNYLLRSLERWCNFYSFLRAARREPSSSKFWKPLTFSRHTRITMVALAAVAMRLQYTDRRTRLAMRAYNPCAARLILWCWNCSRSWVDGGIIPLQNRSWGFGASCGLKVREEAGRLSPPQSVSRLDSVQWWLESMFQIISWDLEFRISRFA